MVEEAQLEETESGLQPRQRGWFVVNVRDARWRRSDAGGAACAFEGPEAWFPQLGITLRVRGPGPSNCLDSPEEAYAPFPANEAARPRSWRELPWA
jgi:hypothetical protein